MSVTVVNNTIGTPTVVDNRVVVTAVVGSGGSGSQGPPGKSAYEIAVENGFVGTESEWLESLEGPQGPPGITDGEQTINGPKTFTSSPIVPNPLTEFQAANRGWVLANAGGDPEDKGFIGLLKGYIYREHYLDGYRWANNSLGTGSSVSVAQNPGNTIFGALRLQTGTTTTGYGSIISPNEARFFKIGDSSIKIENLIVVNDPLSDNTDSYYIQIGFSTALMSAATFDGIYFRYSHNRSGGNWEAVVRESNIEEIVDTGISLVQNVSVLLSIEIDSLGLVSFLINGEKEAEIEATNDIKYSVVCGVRKQSGSLNRRIFIDYTNFEYLFDL